MGETKTNVQTAYGEMWDAFAEKKAGSYLNDKYKADNISGLTGMAREAEILRQLDLQPQDVLIDVGCASGHEVFSAASKCARAVGIDVGKQFIETAKQEEKRLGTANTEFILTDGSRIPFPDGTFDKLICSEVIEHVEDHHSFLDDLIRVVKPGGALVLTVPNWNSRGTLWKRFRNGFRPFPFTPLTDFSMEGIAKHGDAHVRQFSVDEFAEYARGHGLVVAYAGGAAFIDGPYIGRLVQIINRPHIMQIFSFWLERQIARVPLLRKFGRQIILKAIKPKK